METDKSEVVVNKNHALLEFLPPFLKSDKIHFSCTLTTIIIIIIVMNNEHSIKENLIT